MSTDTIVSIDLFSDEERQLLNQLAEGTGFTADRGTVYKAALDLRQLMDEEDGDFVSIADALCGKLRGLTDSEWVDLRAYLPFPVNIAATHDFIEGDLPDETTL